MEPLSNRPADVPMPTPEERRIKEHTYRRAYMDGRAMAMDAFYDRIPALGRVGATTSSGTSGSMICAHGQRQIAARARCHRPPIPNEIDSRRPALYTPSARDAAWRVRLAA